MDLRGDDRGTYPGSSGSVSVSVCLHICFLPPSFPPGQRLAVFQTAQRVIDYFVIDLLGCCWCLCEAQSTKINPLLLVRRWTDVDGE